MEQEPIFKLSQMLELIAYQDMGVSTRNIEGRADGSFMCLCFFDGRDVFSIATPDFAFTAEFDSLNVDFFHGFLKVNEILIRLENDSVYGMLERQLLYGETEITYYDARTIFADMRQHNRDEKPYQPWLLFFNNSGDIVHADDIIEDYKLDYENKKESE